MKLDKKKSLLQKRRWRIRKKVNGTAARPRLAVHFSNKHIYAQCIDDIQGHTLAAVSSSHTPQFWETAYITMRGIINIETFH